MVESPGLNPDWLGESRLLSRKNLYIVSKTIFSYILLHIHSNEMGL